MTQIEKIQALRDLGYDVQIIDGNPTISKGLNLYNNTKITSLPDNLVVGGSLSLVCSNVSSLPKNLVVGDSLDLRFSKIKSLPDNLIVCGWLDLSNTEITSLPKNCIIGWLNLNGTKVTYLPDNLIIGGSLFLTGSKVTSLPKNLIVGHSLDISYSNITSLPDDILVGYMIHRYNNSTFTQQNNNIDFIQKIWGNKPYCLIDGIFSKVLKRNGKVWTACEIGETVPFYIVNDGNGNYAHGNSIRNAKIDLFFKITNRDTSLYKDLSLNSTLSYEDAILCYRTITGACSFGTRNFVENILPPNKLKESYTIAEIIRLTEGQYGNKAFANFFKK